MNITGSFVTHFKNNKPMDTFFNLKRPEDISTIYHQEYVGGIDGDMDYWCLPPTGFHHKCDLILGVFCPQVGLVVGVTQKETECEYRILVKGGKSLPPILTEMGVLVNHPYTDHEIKEIIDTIR